MIGRRDVGRGEVRERYGCTGVVRSREEVEERAERERRGKERRETEMELRSWNKERAPPRLPLSNSIQHSFPFLISRLDLTVPRR